MKTFLTACLWMALAACAAVIFSLLGQREVLIREKGEARQREEVLRVLYDQAKEEGEEAAARWETERTKMRGTIALAEREKEALTREMDRLSAELAQAREASAPAEEAPTPVTPSLREKEEEAETGRAERDEGDAPSRDGRDSGLWETLFVTETPAPAPLFLLEPEPTPAG